MLSEDDIIILGGNNYYEWKARSFFSKSTRKGEESK